MQTSDSYFEDHLAPDDSVLLDCVLLAPFLPPRRIFSLALWDGPGAVFTGEVNRSDLLQNLLDFLLRYEGLPTAWATQMLKVHAHLLIWRDAGIAVGGNVERCANLLQIELARGGTPVDYRRRKSPCLRHCLVAPIIL